MRVLLRSALLTATVFGLMQPVPAMAKQPEITIQQPPGFNWATFKQIISDPSPSVTGAAITVASIAMWSAIGDFMGHTRMCQEANSALADTTHHQFSITVNVVNAGGDPVGSYTQTYLAVYTADSVAYAPIQVFPDGRTVTGPIKACPGAKSWRLPPGASSPPTAGPAHNRAGIKRIAYETPHGNLRVLLPDDMRAGDTISGTVLAEPAGDTPEARVANMGQLNGYVLDIEGKRTPVSAGMVQLSVDLAGGLIPLVLRDPAAKHVAVLGALATTPEMTPPAQQPVPATSPASSPIAIPGQFDGNSANTTATINGQPVQIIAESPRSAVVDCPPQLTGPAQIAVTDNGQTATAKTNVIGIDLSAPRTTLLRGEKTQMTMKVMGLQGLTQPVQVDLTASPNVRLQGGNAQTVTIDPARAGPGGVQTVNYQLSFQSPGAFQVNAALRPPGEASQLQPAPSQPPPTPLRRRMPGM